MDPEGQLRNLRDFLLVYNRMTENCFKRCTSNFNYRNLTMDEERCADSCAGKLIRSNHRIMGTYVQLMPAMVQRRMEEMESKAAEIPKATEAGESVEPLDGGLKSPDTSSAFATAPPGVPTPTSAGEQAGSLASNGTFRSTPTLATNEKLGSPDHTISFVTESTHTDDPPAIVSSLGMKSPHLEGLKVSAPPVNSSVTSPSSATADIQLRTVAAHHIGVVNSSISPPASAHQSTDGEGPPS